MKAFTLTLLFISSFGYTQTDESVQPESLKKLHSRTAFVRDSINSLLKISNKKISDETDPKRKEFLIHENDQLWIISDQNDIEDLKIDIAFCKNNPDCAYSFNTVNNQLSRQPGKNFYNDFEEVYANATTRLKESEIGKQMFTKLKYFKQSMVGSRAPDVEGVDISGNQFKLESVYSDKIVLVDFWASWCAPCREEFQFMNNLREKYKDFGFEIVSITIDDDLSKWKAAVEKDKIESWKHYSTLENKSSAKTDYFVNGVPHKVLVDKSGKIIGKWKASGEINKKELQNQLAMLFGF